MELERPRTVGVEHVGLWAMERLGLGRLLEGLGFTPRRDPSRTPGFPLSRE